jgi:hypothetical protein
MGKDSRHVRTQAEANCAMSAFIVTLHLIVLGIAAFELWLTWRIRNSINAQIEDFAKTQRAAQTARFASVAALCVIATAFVMSRKTK